MSLDGAVEACAHSGPSLIYQLASFPEWKAHIAYEFHAPMLSNELSKNLWIASVILFPITANNR